MNNQEKQNIASESPVHYQSQTTFTDAQIELLNAMAWIHSDEEVRELQHAISEFFANRADKALDELWDNGTLDAQALQEHRKKHYRTPYNNSL